MEFYPDQRLAITKTIIELTEMSEGSNQELLKSSLHRKAKYEDDVMVFYR